MIGVQVTDTGIGISKEQQIAFVRIVPAGRNVDNAALRRHRPRARHFAKSRTGHGWRDFRALGHRPRQLFCIRRALQKNHRRASSLPAEVRTRPRSADVLRGRRILLAEDNPINQQLALEFLQRADATIDVAATGQAAIDLALVGGYDVILMDIHMPQVDGLVATRAIRAAGLTLPIVAVSADALAERRSAALLAGCNAYVTKPIDFDELLATMNGLLGGPLPESNHSGAARATRAKRCRLPISSISACRASTSAMRSRVTTAT